METSKPTNLKFLVIWDHSDDISGAIEKDKQLLSGYCKKLVEKGYDIDYEELSTKEINSYSVITKKCDNKTRVIIWYTGHGKNLNKQVRTQKDQFPCFAGDEIFIQQHKLLERLPRNIMNVIIFDCCNNSPHRDGQDVDVIVKKNFTTLFDFEGEMLINSAKRNQSSFCRSTEGSDFTIAFINQFCDTYDNTIHILTNYVSSSLISYGSLQYEKYIKEDELMLKSDVIDQRKAEENMLFGLMDDINVKQHNSKKSKRKISIEKEMDKNVGELSQSIDQSS